jgi:transcriptional regulator with XRE-family HTH domain
MVKSFGERIRELREASDLSLRELARKVGMFLRHLSDVEFGRRFPSDKTLATLAAALGTTAEDLQQYDSRPPIEEIKRQASANPALGFAFRRMAELPPDELLRRLNEVVPPPKEGKK